MSAKGLSLPKFYDNMEYSTTAYVLCGLAVIVFWNIFTRCVVKSGDSKRPPRSKREERNGVTFTAVPFAAAAPEVGGTEDHSESNHLLENGNAGHATTEQVSNQGDFIEMRSSTNGVRELSRLAREDLPRSGAAEVEVGDESVAQEAGWKGEGPHVVHMLEYGWTEEDLDALQTPIEVYSWFIHHQSCGCSFELEVTLQDKRRKKIAKCHHYPEPCKPGATIYKKVSLIFENYGAGVRYVSYSHRRRKPIDKECQGHCSSEMYSGLRKLLKINI